jgi:hypothetical protein
MIIYNLRHIFGVGSCFESVASGTKSMSWHSSFGGPGDGKLYIGECEHNPSYTGDDISYTAEDISSYIAKGDR